MGKYGTKELHIGRSDLSALFLCFWPFEDKNILGNWRAFYSGYYHSIQVAKVPQRDWWQNSSSSSDPSLLQFRLEFAGINAPKSSSHSPVCSVLQHLMWEEGSHVGEGDSVWVCGLQLLRSVSNLAVETQLCVTRGKDCVVHRASGTNKGPLWPCQILPTAKLWLCTEGSGSALWRMAAAMGAVGRKGKLVRSRDPRHKMHLFAILLVGTLSKLYTPLLISLYLMARKAHKQAQFWKAFWLCSLHFLI